MRHDLNWFNETLTKLIWENFDLMPYKEQDQKTTTNKDGQEGQEELGEEVKLPQDPSQAATALSKSNFNSQPTLAGAAQPSASLTVPNTGRASEMAGDPNMRVWPITDPDNLWFCVMNMDVDGYYCEFKQPEGRLNEQIDDLINEKIEG